MPTPLPELLTRCRDRLLQERIAAGHWVGELSSSALSTATAAFALSLIDAAHNECRYRSLIEGGLAWLAKTQNPDGGWGDTDRSLSNISTTALVWGLLARPEAAGYTETTRRVEAWLIREAGSLEPDRLAKTIADRYGKDRTFSVPILTMLSLAGRLGPSPACWRRVAQLPFELAALPFRWFQIVRLPVVSYALPALIAIGQVRHHQRPTWFLPWRWLRSRLRPRTLALLREIQPTTGGYLEATPLTSFVVMSLVASGQVDSPVVQEGTRFLIDSVRSDGSWPIDTNLATWVTSLSVNALGDALPDPDRERIREWLLQQQYRVEHPYTRAAPGGWAWTDLSGGVPDADDTPGALLALRQLGGEVDHAAIAAGVGWLLDLQNADGGIPTFCKGWTGLPFDRSSNDLTAHTLLAWHAWYDLLPHDLQQRVDRATSSALTYLKKTQAADGSWAPLWFGNQHASEIANLTYGTSRVVRLRTIARLSDPAWQECLNRGRGWLESAQNPDGGWGGRPGTPSSIEETSLALEGLAAWPERNAIVIERGLAWLDQATQGATSFPPSPIGFYFANLWYYERLYPLIDMTAALTRLHHHS